MTRYKDLLRSFAVLIVFSLPLAIPVASQVNTGDITGRVTDEQGHVVPGATVTATNKGTGASRTVITNDAGEYTLTQLPPGKYDLTVEAKNFSKALAQDFELNVGSKPTLNLTQAGRIVSNCRCYDGKRPRGNNQI